MPDRARTTRCEYVPVSSCAAVPGGTRSSCPGQACPRILWSCGPATLSGLPLPQAVPHLAGLLFPMQAPVCRVGQAFRGGFAFGVDEGAWRQPAVGFQGGTGGDEQVLVERRVEENQVEGRRRAAGEQVQCVLLQYLAA